MEYSDSIARLFELDSKEAILATRPKNVLSLYTLFFRNAKREVLLFHPSLNPEIFDNSYLCREMERAVRRNVVVEAIAERPVKPSKFLDKLIALNQWSPYANYTELPIGYLPITQTSEFCVVDNKAFRFKGHNGTDGHAYINNQELAGKLTSFFNVLRRNLDGIPINS